MISPSYILYTQVWASLSLGALMPQYVAQDCPSHSLFHFTSLSQATTIWGMYFGHTIPSKGRNHLIRYLATLLWSLEKLAYVKAHYGMACHYEVPTLLSMVCKLFFAITLNDLLYWKAGGALDLIQDCRWCPLLIFRSITCALSPNFVKRLKHMHYK